MKIMKTYINKLSILVIISMALVTLPSCSDFLDQEPDERVIIQNIDQVIKLLGTGYSDSNYGWLCEVSSDNVIDVNAPYKAPGGTGAVVHYNLSAYGREDDEAYRFEPVKSSTNSDSPSSIWESCYHAIAVANHALQYLDEICAASTDTTFRTSEKVKAAYAEAYLIRAYHHFILVNIFSKVYRNDSLSREDIGIPYCTTIEENLIKTYERGNVTETYKRIEEDLLKGLAWVSDINYKMPKWHFNVNAAHAFAARFYLLKRNYDKVIEHADAVLGTDYATLPAKLMSFANFDSCTTGTDYAEIWQGPKENNNLMLIATYSTQMRRAVGCRYACAGEAIKAVWYHTGPDHNWTALPTAFVGGETFYDGVADHGFASSRVYERFEYTDKVAGIGYAHVIRREFTANTLLLERAEAKLIGKHDINGAVQDLIAYEDSRFSFSEENKSYYDADQLTKALIDKHYNYQKSTLSINSKNDWSFTSRISPDFVITTDLYNYMNCLNDFRRYETAYTGLRFFDLKRWGEDYYHVYVAGADEVADTLWNNWDDPRRAIEVPQEVLAAGMASSRPTSGAPTRTLSRTALKRTIKE